MEIEEVVKIIEDIRNCVGCRDYNIYLLEKALTPLMINKIHRKFKCSGGRMTRENNFTIEDFEEEWTKLFLRIVRTVDQNKIETSGILSYFKSMNWGHVKSNKLKFNESFGELDRPVTNEYDSDKTTIESNEGKESDELFKIEVLTYFSGRDKLIVEAFMNGEADDNIIQKVGVSWTALQQAKGRIAGIVPSIIKGRGR